MEHELRETQNDADQLRGRLESAETERLTAENGHRESIARVVQLERQLRETESEKDGLGDRLSGAQEERLTAENGRRELVVRVAELEQSAVGRDEELRDAVERRSQLQQQIDTLLRTLHDTETSSEMDSDDGLLQTTASDCCLAEAVERLIQRLHDKSAVRYYLLLLLVRQNHSCSATGSI